MLEIWCEEFSPDTFWQQSYQTFLASLSGRVAAHKSTAKRDLALAYHTGAFSRASKVKPLNHYLGQMNEERDQAAEALVFFRSMQAKGLPVSIKRIDKAN